MPLVLVLSLLFTSNSAAERLPVFSIIPNVAAPSGNIFSGAYVVFTPDGTQGYLTNFGADTVTVFNVGTSAVSSTVNVGDQPVAAAASPAGDKVYVPNQNAGTVSVINTSTNTVTATITVGMTPVRVMFNSPSGPRNLSPWGL